MAKQIKSKEEITTDITKTPEEKVETALDGLGTEDLMVLNFVIKDIQQKRRNEMDSRSQSGEAVELLPFILPPDDELVNLDPEHTEWVKKINTLVEEDRTFTPEIFQALKQSLFLAARESSIL